MINLRKRLGLTYTLFISLSLALLALVINKYSSYLFSELAKDNIKKRSEEIVRGVSDLYNPLQGGFDTVSLEVLGMYFTHEGYIITVKDSEGLVWDAFSCDMQQCIMVIQDIETRMENNFNLKGMLQKESYPLMFHGKQIASIDIASYGPFFYSASESVFLSSLNRLLVISAGVFILLSIVLSLVLAAAIAKPVRAASAAAKRIAGGNLDLRLSANYHTAELFELSESLNTMAAELQEAERRQKQLTQDVSHELRTPIACLQGSIEAMIDGVWEPTAERLASCHEEIKRLAKLVEDLNTLTNLEWQNITLNKTEFDIAALMNVCVPPFIPAAKEKSLDIICRAEPALLHADYDRLKQVFFNLLSNAVKYTDTGSITLSGHKKAASYEISVTDTGIGIAEDDRARIFERFYRTDKSRNRGSGGSGIGLTIAAAIVKAHGGTMTCESGGTGTVFRVDLPPA
jgi:signal transduction histidine kinase